MKMFILIIAVPFILSACSAGSYSTDRVNYANPTTANYGSMNSESYRSPEVRSSGTKGGSLVSSKLSGRSGRAR